MIARGNAPYDTGRPYNNLLRRLNASDFALLEPHLAHEESPAGGLLYNSGDDVDTVHFPCGPGLASFMVPNEDGRLGVGRSYTSRVIQTFKAEGVLETRRGSILVRNRDALRLRSCLCNESVKNHFEEVLRGVYPTEEAHRP